MRTHGRSGTMANTRGASLTQLGLPPGWSYHFAQQKTVTVPVAVDKESHDVASVVDPIRISENGSRCIDRSEFAPSEQQTMIVAAVVNSDPNDIAPRM